METQEFIPIDLFCRQHGITVSFISSLQEFGLIEIVQVNEAECIPGNQLNEAEKLLRLHADLDINLEGIDAITHLLHIIKDMQVEIQLLKNQLRFYESE